MKSTAAVVGLLLKWCAQVFAAAAPRPNVLIIAMDNLNQWVGHLGRNPQTKTPNIDRLAKMGVTVTRAYCAAAGRISGLAEGTFVFQV